jgi:hypothetical protein
MSADPSGYLNKFLNFFNEDSATLWQNFLKDHLGVEGIFLLFVLYLVYLLLQKKSIISALKHMLNHSMKSEINENMKVNFRQVFGGKGNFWFYFIFFLILCFSVLFHLLG